MAIHGGEIRLPKAGIVKAALHRLPDESWTVKSATVSQDSDGKYYVSVLFEYEAEVLPVQAAKEGTLGLDYKVSCLYVDSEGNSGGMPKYYKNLHRELARQQRKLSQRYGSRKGEKKSANYKKQERVVNSKQNLPQNSKPEEGLSA